MDNLPTIKNVCDDQRIRVATAESVTVGHLQAIIASIPGASTFFSGGITAYNIDEKVRLLGVDRAHAELVDCVSPKVAEQMALGATQLFDAEIALATTGYAEPPDSNSPNVHAYYAIWDKRTPAYSPVRSGKLEDVYGDSDDDRVRIQRQYAEKVLDELFEYLIISMSNRPK